MMSKYDEMSDEELMKVSSPDPSQNPDPSEDDVPEGGLLEDALETPAPDEGAGEQEESVSDKDHTTPHQSEEGDGEEDPDAGEGGEEDPEAEGDKGEKDGEEDKDPDADPAAQKKADEPAKDDKAPKEDEPAKAEEPVNYEDAYKQIMAPFKANGKTFTPQSPDEVVRLMQQGANYVKKMTALKPNLKLMRMLQNNDLLEESKLSYLIDLDRGDPKAIQKLLHERKIDPLDLDASAKPEYTPGNHTVSDQEMDFQDTLGDVMSTPEGAKTIQAMNTWDAASKEAVYREPQVMRLINQQRESGVYDRIAAEIDRRRTLGTLGTNVPFIEAYKQVGDDLHAQGKLFPNAAPSPSPETNRQPLGQRPSRRVTATNSDKAKAASPSKATPKTPPKAFNPFEMSDEEIMAATSPRI